MTFISFTAGAVLGILIMLVLLFILVKQAKRSSQAHCETTEQLMRERNEFDRQKIAVLEEIEATLRGFTNYKS
jgi:hypothetical protein